MKTQIHIGPESYIEVYKTKSHTIINFVRGNHVTGFALLPGHVSQLVEAIDYGEVKTNRGKIDSLIKIANKHYSEKLNEEHGDIGIQRYYDSKMPGEYTGD
jgi:hypothetical protein